jgi:predicted Holliday junction resolvase-like endonuclease
MTTELIIDHIRNNWWILLFIICMTTWFVYSLIRDHLELKKAKDKKKELEKEMEGLKAEYGEKAKMLEEKLKEKEKFLSSRGGSAFGGKGGQK